MGWDENVPRCFGMDDLKFALHSTEEGRAFEWLIQLRRNGVNWKQTSKQLKAFLKSKGAKDNHIKEQIKKAKSMMKPWLLD